MVMKVGFVNNLYFRGKTSSAEAPQTKPENKAEVKELAYVTPDFAVSAPQKYTKTDVKTLSNGLKLHCYKLANGHKVTIIPMEGSPAVVKNYVNVGSMNETPDIKGISHFLEHMAFNGTNGENGHIKLEVGDSFKKIDALGGWANASTNYAVTDYVNSTPQLGDKDVEEQIKVIAAMSEDLKLSDEMIAKEKGPVCSEINMILDDPKTIAMDQTVRTLFNVKNPADELVGGSVQHIKNLTRKDVMDYYNKYYTPDNMNLVITGDVEPDEIMKIVSKNFNSKKVSNGRKYEEKLTPINHTIRKDFISDKASSSEIVIGFSGPKNNDAKEKAACDLAKIYLTSYSTDLWQNLKKLNAYPYISGEKISNNPNANKFVYMAMSSSEENTEKVLRSVFKSISNAKPVTDERLEELKRTLLNSRERSLEYSSEVNDYVGHAVLNNSLDGFVNYEDIVKNITKEDVNDALKKYFDISKSAITVVHPKTSSEVSFKGRAKQPINMEKVEHYKAPNNFDVGFYETKSNNIEYGIEFAADVPYNKKTATPRILSLIYSMGSKNYSEDELEEFMHKNDIDVSVCAYNSGIGVCANTGFENRNLIYDKINEILYNPAITQENLDIAKSRLKDSLLRRKNDSFDLYSDYSAQYNPYEYTTEEFLNSIDTITLEDVKDCHKYLLENSRGIVTANLPANHKDVVRKEYLEQIAKYSSVKPNVIRDLKLYTPDSQSKVLTEANNNSQADIMQVYRFKATDDVKDIATIRIMNSILSNSLFNTLREKEHLAYSVHSDISRTEDIGEIACNILTTTDNKSIGEISYDNVQKSINGFNRQIEELKNGKFTDEDFRNAKLAMKADLIENEGVSSKVNNIAVGLSSKHGIDYRNKLFNAIDTITKDDIIKTANRIFASKPIYAITATQDTLDYNKAYFEGLEA